MYPRSRSPSINAAYLPASSRIRITHIGRAMSPQMEAKARELSPDVVHLNVFRTVHLVEECAPTPVIIDLDATIVIAHSEKEQACPTWNG